MNHVVISHHWIGSTEDYHSLLCLFLDSDHVLVGTWNYSCPVGRKKATAWSHRFQLNDEKVKSIFREELEEKLVNYVSVHSKVGELVIQICEKTAVISTNDLNQTAKKSADFGDICWTDKCSEAHSPGSEHNEEHSKPIYRLSRGLRNDCNQW